MLFSRFLLFWLQNRWFQLVMVAFSWIINYYVISFMFGCFAPASYVEGFDFWWGIICASACLGGMIYFWWGWRYQDIYIEGLKVLTGSRA